MAPVELEKKVVEFYIVNRPLQSSRNKNDSSSHALPHKACIVGTTDGQYYLIEKGVAPDALTELHRFGGDKGSRIVKIESKLPSGFSEERQVKVKVDNVTLNQLLEASGKDYNWLCNNCWNSTEEMEKLVKGELVLPWKMYAGIGAGLLGTGLAMVLIVIIKLKKNKMRN